MCYVCCVLCVLCVLYVECLMCVVCVLSMSFVLLNPRLPDSLRNGLPGSAGPARQKNRLLVG